MQATLDRLKEILAEVSDLSKAGAVLSWDRETYMPKGGAAARADQLATISRLVHQRFTSPEVGELLGKLADYEKSLPYDSDDAAIIRVTRREYERAVKVPSELVVALSQAGSRGHVDWRKAREAKDFKLFQNALGEIVRLTVELTDALGWKQHRFDALIEGSEPGVTTEMLDKLFAELRETLVPLVLAISARPPIDDSVLHQHWDEDAQWQASLEVLRLIGYDFDRGRQDKSVHPFTTSFSPDDVRVTTRIWPNFFNACFFAAVHEGGHALYEQGIPGHFRRTPLEGGTSGGVHESQSRLWENVIGRSRPFWEYFLPRLRKFFPRQLEGVTAEQFYRAVNKSQPSLIRVEADEVTYNLHIMLRFELERALLDGQLPVTDLAGAWNEKIRQYLGLEVPNDLEGVLQDIHWSFGGLGGFPSYTLGNVISIQLFDQAVADRPEIPSEIGKGNLAPVLEWMREHVHRHGSKFTPSELLIKATGQDLTAKPYLAYIKRKFGELYDLG